MIDKKIAKILNNLTFEGLQEVREFIDSLLRKTGEKYDHRSQGERFKTQITGSCVIEREREFFNQEHKIVIVDLSSTGLKFLSAANIIHGDFMQIFFLSPLGKMKDIHVKVMRIREIEVDRQPMIEAGAKSVTYEELINFRRALAKGMASRKA